MSKREYSAPEAEKAYRKRRKKCRRPRLLEQVDLKRLVMRLFLQEQWSPEQIATRLTHENNAPRLSYTTIYLAICAGAKAFRKEFRKLRYRGKARRHKGTVEIRGKIVISNRIQGRPKEVDSRQVIGHWEADPLAGKQARPVR